MKPRYVLIALLLALTAAAGTHVFHISRSGTTDAGKPEKQKKIPVVETAAADQATVLRRLELTGSVEPHRVAHLASPAEGPLENISVREGDRVKAGEKLVLIGRRLGAEALINSLREELKKEEANLSRVRRLIQSNALAEEKLDQARATYESVRTQLIQAEESAGDHAISAPWNGIISKVEVKQGEFIAPRTRLIEIYDPDSLVIRAAVPERYAAEINPDMTVEIRLDALPEESLRGRIERIYPYLDDRMRTRTVEIVPVEPVDLLPGMFARLQVILEKQDNAVVVPKEAVISSPEGAAVFVVEDQNAVRRPVKTGIEEKRSIQIVSGVLAGEKVIVAGHRKLKHGDTIRAEKGRSQ